jgi:Dolichyl-phosphate-mannose-protein mannosyltransferase
MPEPVRVSSSAVSPKFGKLSFIVWLLLAIIVAGAGVLRFHGINRRGLWFDEMYSVYLATGRGDEVFHLPAGRLLNPPPEILWIGAPSWWHVWLGMKELPYPPIYHIVLRGWMDLFGDGDLATRALSAVCSLISIVVLFDAVRRTSGARAGLVAAVVMALAASQIELGHETRNYTLSLLLGLLACHAVVCIERDGATWGRLLQLGLAISASMLTFYLSVFSIAGLGIYAIRLQPQTRRRVIATILTAGLVTAAAWAPWFVQQYQSKTFDRPNNLWQHDNAPSIARLFVQALKTPSLHLFDNSSLPLVLGSAIIVFVLPIIFIRKDPRPLLWWCWAISTIGGILAWDIVRQTHLIDFSRFTFAATGALCVFAASPLPIQGWRAWVIPSVAIAGLAVATVGNLQSESVSRWPMAPVRADMRELSRWIDRQARADEPLIFYEPTHDAHLNCVSFMHDAPTSRRPIMILEAPAAAAAAQQLAGYSEVFLVFGSAGVDAINQVLPGWRIAESCSIGSNGVAVRMTRS